MPESIDALLITHEHVDHTKGAGVISRRYNIPIYTTQGTHTSMDIGNIADENIKTDRLCGVMRNCKRTYSDIAYFKICIFGDYFNIFIGDEKYSLATDIGKITKSILEKITGSKKILLESNHDVEMLKCGTYPYPLKRRILGEYGHLSNETASKVALHLVQNGTEHIMLGHLSKENNRPEIAMLVRY